MSERRREQAMDDLRALTELLSRAIDAADRASSERAFVDALSDAILVTARLREQLAENIVGQLAVMQAARGRMS